MTKSTDEEREELQRLRGEVCEVEECIDGECPCFGADGFRVPLCLLAGDLDLTGLGTIPAGCPLRKGPVTLKLKEGV